MNTIDECLEKIKEAAVFYESLDPREDAVEGDSYELWGAYALEWASRVPEGTGSLLALLVLGDRQNVRADPKLDQFIAEIEALVDEESHKEIVKDFSQSHWTYLHLFAATILSKQRGFLDQFSDCLLNGDRTRINAAINTLGTVDYWACNKRIKCPADYIPLLRKAMERPDVSSDPELWVSFKDEIRRLEHMATSQRARELGEPIPSWGCTQYDDALNRIWFHVHCVWQSVSFRQVDPELGPATRRYINGKSFRLWAEGNWPTAAASDEVVESLCKLVLSSQTSIANDEQMSAFMAEVQELVDDGPRVPTHHPAHIPFSRTILIELFAAMVLFRERDFTPELEESLFSGDAARVETALLVLDEVLFMADHQEIGSPGSFDLLVPTDQKEKDPPKGCIDLLRRALQRPEFVADRQLSQVVGELLEGSVRLSGEIESRRLELARVPEGLPEYSSLGWLARLRLWLIGR